MKKIGVLTSGGDAPGMNAAIRGIVRAGIYYGMEVYAIKRGYEGLIDGDIEKMELGSVSEIIHKGGTFIGTARSKRFTEPEGFAKALEVIREHGLTDLVVIGGDGSLHGALSLFEAGVNVIGLPGTIDNDLAYTEFTIGFDTAVNTTLSAIGNIRDTSSAHGRAVVIEVMGRHCGDIAIYAGLAGGAESIIIPEAEFDIDDIAKRMIRSRERGKQYSIIVKAEGVKMPSEQLAKKLTELTGIDTRSVVLGYIQRGGNPTARDRVLAGSMAAKAVELIRDGIGGKAVGVRGADITVFDLAEALAAEKTFDPEMMKTAEILAI